MLTTDELARLRGMMESGDCSYETERDYLSALLEAAPELFRVYEAVLAAPEARIVIDSGDLLVDEENMSEDACAAVWREVSDGFGTYRLVPLAAAKGGENG